MRFQALRIVVSELYYNINLNNRLMHILNMILRQIKEDIKVALKKDPAARNATEVLFLYPGVHASVSYTHLTLPTIYSV